MKPKFVVLAGGVGSRFSPLKTNKTMFPFMGKPVIQHTLEMIERTTANNTEVAVVCNEDNIEFLKKYQNKTTLYLKTVKQEEALGMADALLNLEEEISESPIIVLNAVDTVKDSLLKRLIESINDENPVITGQKMEEYFPGGYLKTEGKRVVSIVEKPEPDKRPSNLVNLVFHYFPKASEFLELAKKAQEENQDADDVYEIALDELMKKKEVLFHTYEGPWTKLKYPHMVLDMMDFYLKKIKEENQDPIIHKEAMISKSAHISGPVIIEKGAKVYENAVIKGPAYIGKNAVVGTSSLVRESLVEEGSNTGFASEITRSYIGPDCQLHHNFIGDSILEKSVNPSFGTVTANLRFDRKKVNIKMDDSKLETGRDKFGCILAEGVFLGVNCSIMPGVVVGTNQTVDPGTVLYNSKN